MSARALAALALATIASLPCAPARAHDDLQIGARLVVGGGAGWPPQRDVEGIFELGLRSELLFGPPSGDSARVGPAIDLRTATFRSFEAALGVLGLAPLGGDFALTLSVLGGYAAREGPAASAPIAVGTLALAYRPYDHFDVYGHGMSLYASGRAGIADWQTWELTFGLEIDFEFLLVDPILLLVTATRGRDPDEPTPAAAPAAAPR